ncbi:hypothetical protein Tco_1343293 [Tanacetum coccineum]
MSPRRSTFAAMPRGPITFMGPSHLGKREVPIEWQRYRASLPPRVQEWLNSFEEDDPKKVVDIDISNIKIDRPGHDAYGKPLRKIACNRLTSDPDVDEIPNSVQLYREAKQIHAQRLADIDQAKDAKNIDEISQPPAPRAYIFNPPSFKSLMASKTDSTSMIVIGKQTRLKREDLKFLFKGKEMDDHEHLHASVKGESKMMLIDNLPTINEDRENSEEVKENVELMETIEENHQFPKQVPFLL